jgi:gentisate 1,2-dioxygenase
MPTMATFIQRLPAGFAGKPYRQTDGAVFSVVKGSGQVSNEGSGGISEFKFGPCDPVLAHVWTAVRRRLRAV